MSSHRSLIWRITNVLFQDFDHGKIVEDFIPAAWILQVGDRLNYEAGHNIRGVAEVVSVGTRDRESVLCTFKKIYQV